MHAVWSYVTDFGDTAVTVPLAALMLAFLLVARQAPLALGWAAAVGFCAGVIGVLKVLLFLCGHLLAIPQLANPSGHTAISTAIYGGFATVVAPSLPRTPARLALAAGAAVLVLAIAASRAALGFHTGPEVGVGLAVGLAGLALVAVAVARTRPTRLPVGLICAAAALLAMLAHGERWPTEAGVHRIAQWFAFLVPWCGA